MRWSPSFCSLGQFFAVKQETEDIGVSAALSQCPVSSLVLVQKQVQQSWGQDGRHHEEAVVADSPVACCFKSIAALMN